VVNSANNRAEQLGEIGLPQANILQGIYIIKTGGIMAKRCGFRAKRGGIRGKSVNIFQKSFSKRN
jgi:hypothetical protein